MPRKPRCARCQGDLPVSASTGRPRRYCSDACRKAAYRARSRRARSVRSAWWTPTDLAARVSTEHALGLDAAACPTSTLVPDNWLGPEHLDENRRDALTSPLWASLTPVGSTVWLNPPYKPVNVLRAFLARAVETADAGTPVLALLPASTSSQWWHELVVEQGASVEFLRGRLAYGGPHATGGVAPWPSALVHYRAAVTD